MRKHSLAVIASILFAPVLIAQTFEQMSGIRSSETPLSVRMTAMGGAGSMLFDVSSLAANPAVIAGSKRPAISISGSRQSYDYEASGATWLSNASAAIPFRSIVIGLYYAADPRLDSRLSTFIDETGTARYQAAPCEPSCLYAFYPGSLGYERRGNRYGAAIAFQAGALSIGAGAELQSLDERSGIARVVVATSQRSERLFRLTRDHQVVPRAGVIWRVAPRLAVSASYQGGGSFTRDTLACETADIGLPACSSQLATLDRSVIEMPDATRAGASLQLVSGLTVAAEAVRRNYSKLADDPYGIAGNAQRVAYRDVTETHAGAEYRFASIPLAIRTGWWRDPHRFTKVLSATGTIAEAVDHLTLGAAWSVAGTEIGFAFDRPRAGDGRRATIGISHAF